MFELNLHNSFLFLSTTYDGNYYCCWCLRMTSVEEDRKGGGIFHVFRLEKIFQQNTIIIITVAIEEVERMNDVNDPGR